jgi:hypothetical protein
MPSAYAKKKQSKTLAGEVRVTPVAIQGDDDHDVRSVPPSRAVKVYRCPGCDQEIWAGVGHVVVVPKAAPDLRRHWHRACWVSEQRRQQQR